MTALLGTRTCFVAGDTTRSTKHPPNPTNMRRMRDWQSMCCHGKTRWCGHHEGANVVSRSHEGAAGCARAGCKIVHSLESSRAFVVRLSFDNSPLRFLTLWVVRQLDVCAIIPMSVGHTHVLPCSVHIFKSVKVSGVLGNSPLRLCIVWVVPQEDVCATRPNGTVRPCSSHAFHSVNAAALFDLSKSPLRVRILWVVPQSDVSAIPPPRHPPAVR